MAFQIGGVVSKQARRKIINEINVMPLIDIMLVLLVVFMVTAPMLITGVDVNLPDTNAKAIEGSDEPLIVSIDRKGVIYLMDSVVAKEAIVSKLKAITLEKRDTKIFIRADEALNYGIVMQIITDISNAGFTQVGLVSKSK
jgi:biopolymer transport protein TolR